MMKRSTRTGTRQWLIDSRKRAGLTQEKLGALIGVKQDRISLYEHGKGISPAMAKRITAPLDVPWTRFFEEDKP